MATTFDINSVTSSERALDDDQNIESDFSLGDWHFVEKSSCNERISNDKSVEIIGHVISRQISNYKYR